MSDYRLLAIEDNKHIANMICHVAREIGFISECITGAEIITVYEQFKPDVIVLDIMMPEMDGIEVLQFLRSCDCQARVIILSGSEELARRMANTLGTTLGLNIEADIPKPFRVWQMRTVLEEVKASLEKVQKTA
jgi:DNA-binding response OmpR family regulator